MPSEIRGSDNFNSDSVGKVLQVVTATKSDTASHSSGTWTDISGLSVNITPSSTSSKIMVFVNAAVSGSGGAQFLRVERSGTVIAQPTSAGSRSGTFVSNESNGHGNGLQNFGNHYVDSPATTSQRTYKVQWRWQGGTIYMNRSYTDSDNENFPRGVSSITVMEIGA